MNEELHVMFEELNIEITHDEIKKACICLKTGKSAGPDYVLNEFLKHGVSEIHFLEVLFVLLNKMFNLSNFPEAWSERLIVPIHKKCDLDDMANYRGITL